MNENLDTPGTYQPTMTCKQQGSSDGKPHPPVQTIKFATSAILNFLAIRHVTRCFKTKLEDYFKGVLGFPSPFSTGCNGVTVEKDFISELISKIWIWHQRCCPSVIFRVNGIKSSFIQFIFIAIVHVKECFMQCSV